MKGIPASGISSHGIQGALDGEGGGWFPSLLSSSPAISSLSFGRWGRTLGRVVNGSRSGRGGTCERIVSEYYYIFNPSAEPRAKRS